MTGEPRPLAAQVLLRRCDSPLLRSATGCAIDLAEAYGWSAATLTGVFYGLKAVLDDQPPIAALDDQLSWLEADADKTRWSIEHGEGL